MTREERIAEARRLREQGLHYRVIAERVGVSRTTVYRWLNAAYADYERAASRAWKATHKGECEVCGGPTNMSDGRAKAARRCRACTEWPRERIIAAIHDWAAAHDGIPPRSLDWSPSIARALGADYSEDFERYPGRWPETRTARRHFGTFNQAIRAAGYVPHHEPDHRRETYPEMLRLLREGHSPTEVSRILGLSDTAVWQRLRYMGLTVAEARKVAA